MIKINMHGRLGNQLFQYAFARAIAARTGEEIIIDFNNVINHPNANSGFGWTDSLKDFNVRPYKVYKGALPVIFYHATLGQVRSAILSKSITVDRNQIQKRYQAELKYCDFFNSSGFYCISNGYYPFNLDRKNVYLSGSFESPKYFSSIESIIFDEFQPKVGIKKQNLKLSGILSSRQSVCVSIRVFSEISSKNPSANLRNVCGISYYKRAIEIIRQKLSDPLFYICSNDINWVRNNLNTNLNDFIFEKSDEETWEKLRLMYQCKHFIISNSTFSWWAQYLSRNKDKIVVSPKKWFNDEFNSPLIDKKWVLL